MEREPHVLKSVLNNDSPGLVELRLITFIPMSRVSDPLGVQYQADGPGFSYTRREYRTRHTLVFDPTKITPSDHLSGRSGLGATAVPRGFLIDDDRDIGLSISYLPTTYLPGGIRPIMYGELDRARADRMASMNWWLRRSAEGSFTLTMVANATNPVAVSRYVGIVPAINYSVEFRFARDGSVRVQGTHDGFPAYNFYFQKQEFHRYDPIAAGASPLSLFGPAPDRELKERRLR
jgi:hypothetical protein